MLQELATESANVEMTLIATFPALADINDGGPAPAAHAGTSLQNGLEAVGAHQ